MAILITGPVLTRPVPVPCQIFGIMTRAGLDSFRRYMAIWRAKPCGAVTCSFLKRKLTSLRTIIIFTDYNLPLSLQLVTEIKHTLLFRLRMFAGFL